MSAVTMLGLSAAACTTLAFLPQVVRNWRTRSVDDLSFGTFGLFSIGIVLWLAYGLVIGDVPLIVANVVTLLLTLANLAQMVWYRDRGGPTGG